MYRTGKKFSKPSLSRVINGDLVLTERDTKKPRIRLDHTLVEKYPDYNRNTLQSFIKLGYVQVDGKVSSRKPLQMPILNNKKLIKFALPQFMKMNM